MFSVKFLNLFGKISIYFGKLFFPSHILHHNFHEPYLFRFLVNTCFNILCIFYIFLAISYYSILLNSQTIKMNPIETIGKSSKSGKSGNGRGRGGRTSRNDRNCGARGPRGDGEEYLVEKILERRIIDEKVSVTLYFFILYSLFIVTVNLLFLLPFLIALDLFNYHFNDFNNRFCMLSILYALRSNILSNGMATVQTKTRGSQKPICLHVQLKNSKKAVHAALKTTSKIKITWTVLSV